jgi:hydrogenase nickel incorporation protein HypA/HybF
MHELSIIHSIIEAAAEELRQRDNRFTIEAIELKIGELAGVEIETIEFLWSAAVERSALESAALTILRVPGSGTCSDCGHVFQVQQFYDPCPACGSHFIEITAGEDLKIHTITLSEATAHAEGEKNNV